MKAAAALPVKPTIRTSTVEAIDFTSSGDYARISIKVAGECTAEKPRKVAAGWALTIKNCQVPRKLQRVLDTGAFTSSVKEITPYQVKVRDGYEAKVLVKLRSDAPFTFRREGDVVLWEIKNPEAAQAPAAAVPVHIAENAKALTVELQETIKPSPAPSLVVAQKAKLVPNLEKDLVQDKASKQKGFTGRRVTLEFSDAEVRKIFQLIAEVSNLNFLIADDVSGTISLKLVNVPWDQALDVIWKRRISKSAKKAIFFISSRRENSGPLTRTKMMQEGTAKSEWR